MSRLILGPEAERVLKEEGDEYYSDSEANYDVYWPKDWQIEVERLAKNQADDGTRLEIITEPGSSDFWTGLSYLISQGCRFALTQALIMPFPELSEATDQRWPSSSEIQRIVERLKEYRAKKIWEAVLESGQEDMLNRVLHLRQILNISTEGNSFDEILSLGADSDSQHQRSQIDVRYFSAACYSGNPLFVDFLLALHNDPSYRPSVWSVAEGWYTRRNPVGYYQILQKCDPENFFLDLADLNDIDMISYISSQIENGINVGRRLTDRSFESEVLNENKGNVDILLTYLPLYQRTGNAAPLLESFDPSIYPLSTLLIKGAYSIN